MCTKGGCTRATQSNFHIFSSRENAKARRSNVMLALVVGGGRHKNEWLDVDKSAALCTALVQFNQFNAQPQLLPEELNGFPQMKLKHRQTRSKHCLITYF
jgi:hypothetical protein